MSRRHGSRLGPVLVISLWLHLTLLLLLLVTVRYERPEEELPPPATVAMVFEGGKPEGPALPKPPLEIPAPASPPAPPPAPEPVPRDTAELPAVPPSVPSPPKVAEPAAVPAPPAVSPPAPVPAPPPPPMAMAVPRPALPPPRAAPPSSPSPRPVAPAPPAFPAPMNFSFNQPPARPQPRSASRAPATLDFSLAPRQGATDVTPFSRVAGAHVGPDWRNELSAWVRAHAYYPEQAAMNGEDGNAMVRVVANPDGRVTSVQLESKSGSVWLDMALLALFRDAHLPPLHGENEPITFDFTMHYILIRVR